MLNYKATYDKTTGKVIVKWYDADGNEVPGEPGTYKVKVPADSFLWRGDGIGITFNTTPVNISASSNEYNTVVNSDSVYATDRLGNMITGSSNIIIKSNESISFTLDNIGSADCLSFTIDKKGTFNHPTTGGSYSGDAYMDSSETSDMYNITDISFVDGSTGNSLYINGVKTAVTGDKYFALTPSADNITSFSGNQENEGDSWNIVSVNHLNTSKIDDMSYSFANQTYLTTINSSFEHCTNFTSTFLMCTALTNITSACAFKVSKSVLFCSVMTLSL